MKHFIIAFCACILLSACGSKQALEVQDEQTGEIHFSNEDNTWYLFDSGKKIPFSHVDDGNVSLINPDGSQTAYDISVKDNILYEEQGKLAVLKFDDGKIYGMENNGLLGKIENLKLYFEGSPSVKFNREPEPAEALWIFYIFYFNGEPIEQALPPTQPGEV